MHHLQQTQQERLRAIFAAHPLVRAHELRSHGITAATISRAETSGLIGRVSRGLYQSLTSDLDINQSLAEVSKQVPKGVICLVSALAYHGLTDQMPRQVWIAIPASAWAPQLSYPPVKLVRFNPPYIGDGIGHHIIAGVQVPIYSIPKTLADAFRNLRLVSRAVAVEGLKTALREKKTTPSDIFEAAKKGGALKAIQPYLEALTSNG